MIYLLLLKTDSGLLTAKSTFFVFFGMMEIVASIGKDSDASVETCCWTRKHVRLVFYFFIFSICFSSVIEMNDCRSIKIGFVTAFL